MVNNTEVTFIGNTYRRRRLFSINMVAWVTFAMVVLMSQHTIIPLRATLLNIFLENWFLYSIMAFRYWPSCVLAHPFFVNFFNSTTCVSHNVTNWKDPMWLRPTNALDCAITVPLIDQQVWGIHKLQGMLKWSENSHQLEHRRIKKPCNQNAFLLLL